jgi:hypothetical protein
VHDDASTGIHVHDDASTGIHVHDDAPTGIHVHDDASTGIHVHDDASTGIHVHDDAPTGIHVHDDASTGIHVHAHQASTCMRVLCTSLRASSVCDRVSKHQLTSVRVGADTVHRATTRARRWTKYGRSEGWHWRS